MPQASTSIHKNRLDEIIEGGALKRYSESEIICCKIVGKGGFGVVQKAHLKHAGITVALKMLFVKEEQDLYEKFVKEVCGYCSAVACHTLKLYLKINQFYVLYMYSS